MSKNVKYKTTYLKRGAMIVKGPCKYEDEYGGSASESVIVVDPLDSGSVVGERLHVLKIEFIEAINTVPRKKKPSDTKCYKWMVDNGWKQKSNWKDIQKAYQWVFNNKSVCFFSDKYFSPLNCFIFRNTPNQSLWQNVTYINVD